MKGWSTADIAKTYDIDSILLQVILVATKLHGAK